MAGRFSCIIFLDRLCIGVAFVKHINFVSLPKIEQCVSDLKTEKGIGVITDFLKDRTRVQLLKELERYEFRAADRERGPRRVKQDYASFDAFPEGSLFHSVRDELQEYLASEFVSLFPFHLTDTLQFTHMVAQRYDPCSIAIGAHYDGESYINLIALLVLEGRNGLHSCDDGDGKNPELVPNQASDLILMRGSGFAHIEKRPYHLVCDITGRRTTVGFRQKKNCA